MADIIADREKVFDEGHVSYVPEFQSPEILYDKLIENVRKYHPSDDISLIEKAYKLAYLAHENQVRKSGEPYIVHPLCVSIILAELEMDKETIAAGLLHDVVEDTIYTKEQIAEKFGRDVAELVDGVTKLNKMHYKLDKNEMQAENLRKMFLAMAKDIRVIIIKLADRLHNMRTLKHMKPEKQQEIARETMDIYAPLAMRLGISRIKVELDDLSLKYLQPDVYYDLVDKIALRKSEREKFVADIADEVRTHIENAGIEAQVDGRIKHFFSIYKKMVNQNKSLDQIYDLFAVRIIVDSIKDCYAALGVIHEMYKPLPGRFKDYIAMPKPNMYQSLHTTLIGKNGIPFEIQIRTYEMHRTAEYGIAAHWKYKEASDGKQVEAQEAEKLSWLRQILEWQKDMTDNKEFMKTLKSDLDLFSDHVYCFTPEGEVKTLPYGSTPVDFAYAVHTAVGNKMVGARVNGKIVNIDYEINNGDRIEIITSGNSKGPSRDWLNIVKSSQAKSKINQWFRNELKEDNILRGKDAFASYCKNKNINPANFMIPEYMDSILKKYGFKDWEQVYAAIGHGGLKEGQVVNRMQELYDHDHEAPTTDEDIIAEIEENTSKKVKRSKTGGIMVRGIHDLAVRYPKCCAPLPGDDIIGFVTRGRGITIHRTDCVNVINMPEEDRQRFIEAEWDTEEHDKNDNHGGSTYLSELNIYANNRNGLLLDVSRTFTDAGISIDALNSKTSKQGVATISVSFELHNTSELNMISEKLRNIPNVIDIERTMG